MDRGTGVYVMTNSALEGEVEDRGHMPKKACSHWCFSGMATATELGLVGSSHILCRYSGPGILTEYFRNPLVMTFSEGGWVWRGSL